MQLGSLGPHCVGPLTEESYKGLLPVLYTLGPLGVPIQVRPTHPGPNWETYALGGNKLPVEPFFWGLVSGAQPAPLAPH